MSATRIAGVLGRRIWDSRGRPTVEAEVRLACGAIGRAIAPAGASRGAGEAVDLRDGGASFGGLDVSRAVAAVSGEISASLAGADADDQAGVDRILIALDGTAGKSRLGGNALVAVSMAAARAAAAAAGRPLWRHLGGTADSVLPLPEIQIFGGGAHAGRRIDVQDYMVIAVGAADYVQALDWSAEVYRAAGELLSEAGRRYGVADEGGHWPAFESNEEGLALLVRAIERAGLRPGEDMAISLDIAASELGRNGRYSLAHEGRDLDGDALRALLLDWIRRYPIVAIEDPLAEDDAEGWVEFTRAAGTGVEVVGDDLLVTDAARVAAAAERGACNAVLLKPNQAGTLSETRAALDAARRAGFGAIVSARSGESEDATIVHLAVGWGVPQLKVGSIARAERTAKWNEGLRIAEALGGRGWLPAMKFLPWRK
ncbi:MAG TPA: enolase C-terminal domain-like protein [Kiloniellales bacterium]|nr:enolase C-terminal domain-like protein [Kiloniellales bacterium]